MFITESQIAKVLKGWIPLQYPVGGVEVRHPKLVVPRTTDNAIACRRVLALKRIEAQIETLTAFLNFADKGIVFDKFELVRHMSYHKRFSIEEITKRMCVGNDGIKDSDQWLKLKAKHTPNPNVIVHDGYVELDVALSNHKSELVNKQRQDVYDPASPFSYSPHTGISTRIKEGFEGRVNAILFPHNFGFYQGDVNGINNILDDLYKNTLIIRNVMADYPLGNPAIVARWWKIYGRAIADDLAYANEVTL